MPTAKLLGAWGEAQAAEYLRKKHYKLLAQGYRCRYGEVDLIVKNRKYIVFVEVKTRKSDRFAAAREFVDRRKQTRLKSTALIFLSSFPCELQPRFDVIEVYAPEGVKTAKPEIHHLEDAFS